ncbi:feruloyl-CoA synthase [Chelativorans intermedius]|uniref:Feruloyl-CoA synthase n=1 Tax=Chelativorans intermedius TaxID=515947 RepID=A0ABV6D613_9HYPH|nr:feruloyl-CoA synthase [Chelativorans intermedius]MCT8997456.1 feruloyl-CoA synthase [Chelativorans intermedius]
MRHAAWETINQAPVRPVRCAEPKIKVRHGPDGSLYVEQEDRLPAYPERISDMLEHWARHTPDRILFADRGSDGNWRRLSYAQALEKTRRLGQFLIDSGVSPDAPLAILSGNDLEHALLALAAVYVGLPYAAISPAYSLVSEDYSRLRETFETIRPGLVFANDAQRFAPAIEAVAGGVKRLHARGAQSVGEDFSHALTSEPTAAVDKARLAVTGDTIAKFLFTSGSTGSPKAVINTNRMICSNQIMTRETFAYFRDEPPLLLDWAPWHHTAGGNKLFYMPLFNGGTLYIDDGRPTPAEIGKTVRNLKEIAPNWYFNVPKGYEALIPHLEADASLRENFFRHLKMLWYAGAGMAQHTWDTLERLAVETTGERILIATGLGATETAPVALMCTWPQERAGNVGLPCKGVSLKLVPFEGKFDARLKGPNITPGYWRAPQATAEAFDEEGYYRLGDALRFADPDNVAAGFFFDGRTAENFKLDTGTWVNTGALRTAFINHFGVAVREVAIAGADRPYVAALVFPDVERLSRIAGISGHADAAAVFAHPAVRAHLRAKLQSLAAESTGSSTLVRRMILVDPPPSLDRGEMTDKGSINQRAVLRNRAEWVEELYTGSPRVIEI